MLIKDRELADINKIGIVEETTPFTDIIRYAIVTEFSCESIEIFDTYQEGKDFIKGFKGLDISPITPAYHRGSVFRQCINIDINTSKIPIYKKIDLETTYEERLMY